LIALHRNRLPLVYADQLFLAPGVTKANREWSLHVMAEDVWIGHTPQFQQWTGANERMIGIAHEAGLEKRIIKTVPDRNGRPVFEIFRFVRASGAAPSN
jgi:hypothetical protein